MDMINVHHDRFKFIKNLMNHEEDYKIIYLDVIRFRKINEQYGLIEGDKILNKILVTIEETIKNLNIEGEVCMYEKDIFLIVLNNDCKDVLKKFIYGITSFENNYEVNFRVAYMKVKSYDEFIKFIESATVIARRNNCEFDKNNDIEKYDIEEKLIRYLYLKEDILFNRDNSLYLVYQPKVDLNEYNVVGYEALSRWKHPRFGEIYPGEFIPIINELGKEYEFDISVLKKLCEFTNKLRKENISIKISINISISTLKKQNSIDNIIKIIDRNNVDHDNITFEILEGYPIDDYDIITNAINRLYKENFNISIDDFGTGYSSYYRLCAINFSEVKLPREFLLHHIYGEEKQFSIIKGITNMCKELGCTVVMEGIENIHEESLAKDIGIDLAQGYLYARPLLESQVIEQLKGKSV